MGAPATRGRARKNPVVIDVESHVISEKALGGGIEGAQRNTRELVNWNPPIMGPDQKVNRVKEMADARGIDVIQNDGLMTGAIHTHRDGIVGSQYRLSAKPKWRAIPGATEAWAEEFRLYVETRFNLIADSTKCWLDASGTMTLTDMVRLAVGGFVPTGEVLATVEWIDDNPRRPCKTAIQMVSPSRLTNPNLTADTQTLRRGVQKDAKGRPLGYWFSSAHPGDYYTESGGMTWQYVPAEKPWGRPQVIHIVEKMAPDQTRGIADMVSSMKQMKMTSKFQDITLQNAVVNATYAAAIESDLPSEALFASLGAGGGGMKGLLSDYMGALAEYIGDSGNIAIDGVKMPHLFPGTKLNMKPAGTPGGIGQPFEESLIRGICAPLGLSYEQFSKNYTNTNYSSARASLAETFKFMQSRKKVVADRFATSVYVLWLEEEINNPNSKIPLPPGYDRSIFYIDAVINEALTACAWLGAARGQIDEMKETQAAILRINSGLSTREKEVGLQGEDYREVLEQLGREKKLIDELGLDFSGASATKPGANQRQQTVTKSGGDKKQPSKASTT